MFSQSEQRFPDGFFHCLVLHKPRVELLAFKLMKLLNLLGYGWRMSFMLIRNYPIICGLFGALPRPSNCHPLFFRSCLLLAAPCSVPRMQTDPLNPEQIACQTRSQPMLLKLHWCLNFILLSLRWFHVLASSSNTYVLLFCLHIMVTTWWRKWLLL